MPIARIIAAFLIAPLMTPLVILGAARLHSEQFTPRDVLINFVVIGGFAYAPTVIFGIPAFLVFRAKRWRNGFLYFFVGGLIGSLFSVILSVGVSLEYRGWWALAGALSALVFRMISGAKFDHVSRTPLQGET